MLSKRSIVYFGADTWDAVLWRDRHEICTRLAANNRVIYVENRAYFRCLRRRLWNGEIAWRDLRGKSIRKLSPNLFVFRYPDWAPVAGRFPYRQIFAVLRRIALRSSLKKLGFDQPIVWVNTPEMADLVDEVRSAALTIYHVVDQYSEYKDHSFHRRNQILAQENQILQQVDMVIATHAGLLEGKREINPNT